MKLTQDQLNAIDKFHQFLGSTIQYFILEGSAGTGKTTIVKELLNIVRNNHLNYACTATTNKAANVLSNIIGEDVTTIASLLGLRIVNNYSTGVSSLVSTAATHDLDPSIVFIDESSMLDWVTLKYIKTHCTQCKVVFIRDLYQLPAVSVKHKDVLSGLDAIKVSLNKVVRYSNSILKLAEAIKVAVDTSVFPKLSLFSSKEIQLLPYEDFLLEITKCFEENTNKGKVLAWTNQQVINYNKYIRANLGLTNKWQKGDLVTSPNPIMNNGKILYKTDAVLTIESVEKSRYTIANKSIDCYSIRFESYGALIACPENYKEVTQLLKQLARDKDWSTYYRVKETLVDLRHCFASTIHKAQGDTYNTVFIDLEDIAKNNDLIEVAKLLYTGITRATDKVIFCINSSKINFDEEIQLIHLLHGTLND